MAGLAAGRAGGADGGPTAGRGRGVWPSTGPEPGAIRSAAWPFGITTIIGLARPAAIKLSRICLQLRGDIGEFTHVHFLMRMGDGWGPDAYLARQPFFRQYPRLLIYETGVHFIDTFRFLLGEAAVVTAQLKQLNSAIRGEDAAQLLMTFQNGATAVWDATGTTSRRRSRRGSR